jgi:hypothetical protein
VRYCRACKKTVPEEAKVCPQCKKAENIGSFGQRGPGAPSGPSSSTNTGAEKADGEALQFTLRSLEGRLEAGKKRSIWLSLGALIALIAGVAAWGVHYASTVLSYAQLDPDLRIERDAVDPERLLIVYRPLDTGRLGFGRQDPDRETELVDRAQGPSAGEQKFLWRWSGVKTGDQLWVTHRSGWSLRRSELIVPEEPPRPRLGDAVLVGTVVDATKNTPVEGAEVRIVGTPLRANTDADGRFRLTDAPAGPASIEVSAPQFSTDQLERELSDSAETDVRVVLSPGLKTGQIRVVLTWGDRPKDLDAHLVGPLPGGKQFQNLDVDDTDGDGPETITILGVLPGRYSYLVHDYTNQGKPTSKALMRSNAQVKLYQGGQTYRFAIDQSAVGTIWYVCDIEVEDSGKVKVVKVNKYIAE